MRSCARCQPSGERGDARSQCARQCALVLGEFAMVRERRDMTRAIGRAAAARVRQTAPP